MAEQALAEQALAQPTRQTSDDDEALPVVRSVLDGIEASGVRYCHWKSNTNLEHGLRGKTDLDLLVARADRDAFTAVVRAHRFRLFLNPPIRRIAGIEDHLGLDEASGRIVHLHVHYRLVLGERHVKEHHLPLESWLLSGPEHRYGVPIPSPEKELILLSVRAVLKFDALSACAGRLRGSFAAIPAAICHELHALSRNVPESALHRALLTSGLPLAEQELREFIDRVEAGDLSLRYLMLRKRSTLRALRAYERHSTARATARRIAIRIRFDSRVQRAIPVPHKRFPENGMLIAVIGADGSGKTRLVADLGPWLSSKLEVSTLYFGQPKRNRGLIALRRMAKAARRLGTPTQVGDQFEALAWLDIALIRAAKGRQAARRRASGQLVLAERLPLPAFLSMTQPMDGPRLRQRRGPLRQAEAWLYKAIPDPDLVLALSAPLSVLRARAPDTDPIEHAAKAIGVLDLQPSSTTAVLDATRAYADVLSEAKVLIWDRIAAGQDFP